MDISAALLDKALKLEQADPPSIAYLHADAASPSTLRGEEFDGAVCHFGVSDIDDLEGAVATTARLVTPGGASSSR